MPSRRVWGAPRYLDYTDFNTQNLEKPEFSQILKGGGGSDIARKGGIKRVKVLYFYLSFYFCIRYVFFHILIPVSKLQMRLFMNSVGSLVIESS